MMRRRMTVWTQWAATATNATTSTLTTGRSRIGSVATEAAAAAAAAAAARPTSITVASSVRWSRDGPRNAGMTATMRFQSTRSTTSSNSSSSVVPQPQPHQQQHFVKTRLAAGEWDPDSTATAATANPLYRPKFKSSAKILAADDFAMRPTVGFTGEFNSLADAMVTLSWLDQTEHAQIYKLYCDMMLSAERSSNNTSSSTTTTTSHEYVMRVIAQQYNLTAERVAAVVQLQHNEEQMKIMHPEQALLTETANRMDTLIRQEIKDAYGTFKLQPPSDSFTEDPVGVNGMQDRKQWTVADDLLDVDTLTHDATVRLEQTARRIIDGHVYIEDIEDEAIPVPNDHDCRQLIKQQERLKQQHGQQQKDRDVVQTQRAMKTAVEPVWRTVGATGSNETTRPRWKFIAQTVNTRLLKQQKQKHRSYINNSAHNTIVEHEGTLRNGTMADVKTVAWKLTRHAQEHLYAGAKRGWLDRVHNRHTNNGTTQPWGKAPPPVAVVVAAAVAAEGEQPVEADEASTTVAAAVAAEEPNEAITKEVAGAEDVTGESEKKGETIESTASSTDDSETSTGSNNDPSKKDE